MPAALYYPHTALNDTALMKSCLLLWDWVEYISPSSGYKPKYVSKDLAEAAELIAKPYIVTAADQAAVDDEILGLAQRPHRDWLINTKPGLAIDDEQYKMFQSKFSPQLISQLIHNNLATFPAHDPYDFATRTSFGLIMMGILAKHCAGSSKELVTDRVEQYQALAKYYTHLTDGNWIADVPLQIEDVEKRLNAESVLITISANIVDPRSLDIGKLITMRRQENASNATLRANYAKCIQDYVQKLIAAKTAIDLEVAQEEFTLRMKEHLAALEDELRLNLKRTILSKELLIAIVASVTQAPALFANFAGIIGLGALGKLWVDYRAGRNQALAKCPLGFLYKSRRFPYY